MYIRSRTVGARTYFDVVESYREEGKVRKRVVASLGTCATVEEAIGEARQRVADLEAVALRMGEPEPPLPTPGPGPVRVDEYRARARQLLREAPQMEAGAVRAALETWSGRPLVGSYFRARILAPVRAELGLDPPQPAARPIGFGKTVDPPPQEGLRATNTASGLTRRAWNAWLVGQLREYPELVPSVARARFADRWRVWYGDREGFIRHRFNPARLAAGLPPHNSDWA